VTAIVSSAKEQQKAESESVNSAGGPVVTEADIANIVAQWTGIPIEKVIMDLCCSLNLDKIGICP
jgi:ATP-dependent Clp protease ATP-binding subunit ClpC